MFLLGGSKGGLKINPADWEKRELEKLQEDLRKSLLKEI